MDTYPVQSGKPKTYQKGPDVMSKSTQTQQHYAVVFQGQGKLTGFGFKAPTYSLRAHGTKSAGKRMLSPVVKPDQQLITLPPPQSITQPPLLPEPSLPTLGLSQPSRVRSASILSDPSTDNKQETRSVLGDVAKDDVRT